MYITARIIMCKLDRIYIQFMNDKYETIYKTLKTVNSFKFDPSDFKPGSFVVCKTNKNKTTVNEIIKIDEFNI